MMVLIADDVATVFRKRHVEVRDIAKINKQLDEQRKQHMAEHLKPVTVT